MRSLPVLITLLHVSGKNSDKIPRFTGEDLARRRIKALMRVEYQHFGVTSSISFPVPDKHLILFLLHTKHVIKQLLSAGKTGP